MDKPLVTVIVPIYNVGEYLNKCLESICKQTYSLLEIILINDGSSDNSEEICRNYEKGDNRIFVINQDNSGVSTARNRGLSAAHGEYICFVDADDCLETNAIETRLSEIEASDLLITGYKKIDKQDVPISEDIGYSESILDKDTMISYLIYLHPKYRYQGYLWNKLFKAGIIKKNQLRFNEKISYNEDRLFILEYLLHCSNIKLIPVSTYYYRIRSMSAMGQIDKEFKSKMLTEIDAFLCMQECLKHDNNPLYTLVARKTFDCTREWYKRIPEDYRKEREYVRKLVYQSLKICIISKDSVLTIKQKIKCILQYTRFQIRSFIK